tara:strand:+ start:119 stop:862 length:744 start_codon:yes stop_codon:yes gene_type:complete
MCTLLVLFRPNNKWPLIIGGNRDEMLDRNWLPPNNHWGNNIIGGKDEVAGGTWLGLNKYGIVATILNRPNSLGFDERKKSRGNLIIDVLKKNNINDIIDYLSNVNPTNWKPFNLFIANNKKALWVKNDNSKKFKVNIIKPGQHFMDSYDMNSLKSQRYLYNFKNFKKLEPPVPEKNLWTSWKKFLSNKNFPNDNPLAAVNIINKNNYGTLCTNFIALPNKQEKMLKPIYLFNDNTNIKNDYYTVKTW